METDEILVPKVILGGTLKMEQTKEQPKGRFLRLVFKEHVKFPHLNPRSQIEMGRGNF